MRPQTTGSIRLSQEASRRPQLRSIAFTCVLQGTGSCWRVPIVTSVFPIPESTRNTCSQEIFIVQDRAPPWPWPCVPDMLPWLAVLVFLQCLGTVIPTSAQLRCPPRRQWAYNVTVPSSITALHPPSVSISYATRELWLEGSASPPSKRGRGPLTALTACHIPRPSTRRSSRTMPRTSAP